MISCLCVLTRKNTKSSRFSFFPFVSCCTGSGCSSFSGMSASCSTSTSSSPSSRSRCTGFCISKSRTHSRARRIKAPNCAQYTRVCSVESVDLIGAWVELEKMRTPRTLGRAEILFNVSSTSIFYTNDAKIVIETASWTSKITMFCYQKRLGKC